MDKTVLENLKNEIKDFDKYSLNEYHHKDWMTPQEGSKLCDIMISLIEHIETLEKQIKVLENKDPESIQNRVKELRELTNCGLIECKKALDLFDGDVLQSSKFLEIYHQAVCRRKENGEQWTLEDYVAYVKTLD